MTFSMSRFVPLCLMVLIIGYPLRARAGTESSVRVLAPIANGEVIAKHPDIQGVFTVPVDPDSLVVLLDDNDITATVELTANGFHCQPPIILPAGQHVLYIAGTGAHGPFEREITFSSRQYASMDEAYSNNQWTLNMQAGNRHFSNGPDSTFASIDSTLNTDSVIKSGAWTLSLSGNARLLNNSDNGSADATGGDVYGPATQQTYSTDATAGSIASINPVRQGLDLNTMLLRAQYQKNGLTGTAELGDLQLETSANTYPSLARNGGRFVLDGNALFAEGFSVFGRDTFGLRHGFGIGFDNSDHLNGLTGGVRLLDRQVEFKAFYLDGGQSENAYSSWAQESRNRGRILGMVLKTDFLNQALTTEFEYDRSDFDPNASDEFGGNRDEAWRFQIGGQKDIYGYDLTWERFGRNYDLPGAMSPKKDYQGLTFNGSAQWETHGLNLMLAGYRNNVDDDPLYAVINSLSAQLDYMYMGWISFPITLSYQHIQDQSTDEPQDSQETDLSTDALTIGIGYAGTGVFSIDLSTTYSWQDDHTSQDTDIAALTVMISPSLNFDTFFVSMSGGLNQNRDLLSATRTDDYTLTLDAMGTLWADILSYEFGGTYDHSLINDDSGDRSSLTGYGRISYHLPWLSETLNPSLGLEVQYSNNRQKDSPRQEDTRIFCTLSTSMDFNY